MAKVSPWNFYHGRGGGRGPAGHRLSRFKKSAGDRAVNDGRSSMLIQSTLCEKNKIYTSEMLQWFEILTVIVSRHFFFLIYKTKKRKDSLEINKNKQSKQIEMRAISIILYLSIYFSKEIYHYYEYSVKYAINVHFLKSV